MFFCVYEIRQKKYYKFNLNFLLCNSTITTSKWLKHGFGKVI